MRMRAKRRRIYELSPLKDFEIELEGGMIISAKARTLHEFMERALQLFESISRQYHHDPV